MPAVDTPIALSGLLVQPIAQRLAEWISIGKLDEDDLDALSTAARAWVEHSIAGSDWASLPDVEGLMELASAQLGGETGLVEWADEIAGDLLAADSIAELVRTAARLVDDGPGFVVSQSSERLLRRADWRYEGGSERFSVRLQGLDEASPALKSLVGACLARLGAEGDRRAFDVRFEGVDGSELVVFGEFEEVVFSEGEESRLHRAALIPDALGAAN